MQIASVVPRELSGMRGKRAGQENREGETGQGWSGQKAGLAWKEEAERRKGEVQGERGRVRESSRVCEFTFVYLPDVAQYGAPTLDSVHRLDAVLSPLNRVLQDLFRIFHLSFQ